MLHEKKTPQDFIVPDVSDLFQRYTARTDGKGLIANALKELCPQGGTLLDLGAGDGALTSLLSPHFDQVVAVERNEKYRPQLASIPNATVILGRMEDSLEQVRFDVALLSYSLTGVRDERVGAFLRELTDRKNPGGRIFFTTFQDHCDWDSFVTPIYAEIGRPRTGGTRAHVDIVESAGLSVQRVSQIATELFDDSVADLATTLGFFFAPAHSEYFAKRERHTTSLGAFVKPSRHSSVALSCIEEIWEVI